MASEHRPLLVDSGIVRIDYFYIRDALERRTDNQSLTSLHRDRNVLSGMLTDTCMPWSDNEGNDD